ncbi:MAG: hypothetical protein Q8R26_01220 [bacterium]|nr:hypothetical protein [bacterium]
MKKSLFIAVGGALVGIVLWYMLGSGSDFSGNIAPSSDVLSDTATNTVISQATNTVSNITKDPLRIHAFQIIARKTQFKNSLTTGTRESIDKMIEESVALIKKDYDDDMPWLNLGASWKVAGDYDGAVQAWEFLTIIRPQSFVAFNNLGDLYGFYIKNYIKAEYYLLRSIELNTSNVDAYSQLASIYESFPDRLGDIEKLYLKGLALHPQNIWFKIGLGGYYEKIGDIEKALAQYKETLMLDPKNTTLQQLIQQLDKNPPQQ